MDVTVTCEAGMSSALTWLSVKRTYNYDYNKYVMRYALNTSSGKYSVYRITYKLKTDRAVWEDGSTDDVVVDVIAVENSKSSLIAEMTDNLFKGLGDLSNVTSIVRVPVQPSTAKSILISSKSQSVTTYAYLDSTGTTIQLYSAGDIMMATNYYYSHLFANMPKLVDISGLEGVSIGSTSQLESFFEGCTSLTDISPIGRWWYGSSVSYRSMFKGCTSLTDISLLKNIDAKYVENFDSMFEGCTSLADMSALNGWEIRYNASFNYSAKDCPSHPNFTSTDGSWTGTWDSNGTFTLKTTA